jgi:hypothetical protein
MQDLRQTLREKFTTDKIGPGCASKGGPTRDGGFGRRAESCGSGGGVLFASRYGNQANDADCAAVLMAESPAAVDRWALQFVHTV